MCQGTRTARTVILAAIIAAFVFGMSGNIQKSYIVASTIDRSNSTTVTSVFQGGQDASSLTGISWTVNGANVTVTTNNANAKVQSSPSDNYIVAKSGGSLPVGTIVYIPASMNSRITGLGVFSDGSTQIVVDQTI